MIFITLIGLAWLLVLTPQALYLVGLANRQERWKFFHLAELGLGNLILACCAAFIFLLPLLGIYLCHLDAFQYGTSFRETARKGRSKLAAWWREVRNRDSKQAGVHFRPR